MGTMYQIQVRGEWAGCTGGWRPGISGTVNQTGLSDEAASNFTDEDEAIESAREYMRGAEWRVVEVAS